MIALQKLWKCFLFNLKSFFHCQDIQILVFLINLKVYDINCLNKNLIIHFAWYLGKEKRYDTETLSIDRV